MCCSFESCMDCFTLACHGSPSCSYDSETQIIKHLYCKPDFAIHQVIMEMTLYSLVLGNMETGLVEALDLWLILYPSS